MLSEKVSISKLTLKSIFYKKRKTIRIDLIIQICKDLNIKIGYFLIQNYLIKNILCV